MRRLCKSVLNALRGLLQTKTIAITRTAIHSLSDAVCNIVFAVADLHKVTGAHPRRVVGRRWASALTVVLGSIAMNLLARQKQW